MSLKMMDSSENSNHRQKRELKLITEESIYIQEKIAYF